MKRLYVGNVPWEATEEDLLRLFKPHGDVLSVDMVMDRDTGRFRGFSFVNLLDEYAASAMSALNGAELMGRTLVVNEARERGWEKRHDDGRDP